MTCKNCIHENACVLYDEKRTICEYFEDKDLFVKLPCNVGSTVYEIDFYYDCAENKYNTCEMFEYEDEDACLNCYNNKTIWIIREVAFELNMINDIGERIFITKEEAENALEERKK